MLGLVLDPVMEVIEEYGVFRDRLAKLDPCSLEELLSALTAKY